MESFFWFDFETFGANPARDRASQFAAIRTDLNFEIIDEPINIYCRPSDDFLPHPQACLITGITPQKALKEGMIERDFFRKIHLELSTAETCAVGYNNIRFDDEVVRFGFYRNFYDAYAREWQNGNSRWDILDMLRMTHALRPDGIEWPINELGSPSFRLEVLSKANGIEHENAHDALADVYATIGMAKIVKQRQPKLFDYLFGLRDKRKVMAEIDLINHRPFVHCSGMLGPAHAYCGIMMPLVAHPTNKNSVICIDLSQTIEDLSELTAEDFERRIFSRQSDLAEGEARLAIKEIHYNKCPAVAPLGVFNEAVEERLNIDKEDCLQKASVILSSMPTIQGNLLKAYQSKSFEPETNPDYGLYSGGFFKPADKQLMSQIQQTDWPELATTRFDFTDQRLSEMLFRYRARNAPETLNDSEQAKWQAFRKACFFEQSSGSTLLYEDFQRLITEIEREGISDEKAQILSEVAVYVDEITEAFTQVK